ncbi:MAG: SIMPL domain-containing protein [Dehalococcoidia bacterium]|nr:SIMPL domain-containing protein [Dehalococcoidia bacterium]
MKTKLTLIPFALLAAALVVLTAACGGAEAKVTVEKGLAAAAGQEGGTGITVPAAAVPVSYAAAIASKEQAVSSAYGGVTYSAGSMGGGSGGLLIAPQSQGQAGLTVQGYGSATAPADAAKLQFSLALASSGDYYSYYPEPAVPEVMPSDSGTPADETEPLVIPPTPTALPELTESDLSPLIDAIKAQGVSDADIEVVIYPAGGYYGKYGPEGSAQVTVNLDNPADRVGPLVDAGTQAVNESGTLMLQNVSVLYTVDDCSVLLEEARHAAVEDGRENSEGLADALGVSLGELLAASEYVSSPYGPSPCQPASDTYYGYGYEGMSYDPAMAAEVQIVSNVALTFAMS